MTRKAPLLAIIMTLTSMIFHSPGAVYAAEDTSPYVPEGVYLKLTQEFYEHLRNQGQNTDKMYSNDPSQGYLKEIAVSSRFVVETNLQIIKQQERIIQLLQDMLNKQK